MSGVHLRNALDRGLKMPIPVKVDIRAKNVWQQHHNYKYRRDRVGPFDRQKFETMGAKA